MTGKIAIAAASIAIVGGVAGGTIAYKYSQDKAKATDKKEATEATDDTSDQTTTGMSRCFNDRDNDRSVNGDNYRVSYR